MTDSRQPIESRLIITHDTAHLATKKLLRVLSIMQARPPPRYARAAAYIPRRYINPAPVNPAPVY